MPYALALSGGQNVTIPAKTLGQDFYFWIDFQTASYSGTTFIGSGTQTNTYQVYILDAANLIGWRGTSTLTITLSEPIPLNERYYLWFGRNDDGVVTVRNRAGDVIGTLTTTVSIQNFTRIGLSLGRAFNGIIYAMGIATAGVEQIYLNESDPSATTFGDGTLSAGAFWVEYSDTPTVTPIAFSGSIANQVFTEGQAVSVDLTAGFAGTETPFTYANTGTALTGTGLTVSSAGLLSGTAAVGSSAAVVITGTDAATNTAASNAFSLTVNAAVSGVTSDVAVNWPLFSVAVSQSSTAPASVTLTLPPMERNTTALVGEVSFSYVNVAIESSGSHVATIAGLSTNASSILSFTHESLVSGTDYQVSWRETTGQFGIAKVTAP